MWFRLAAAGLVVVVLGGIYARRRIAGALSQLGVRERHIRVVRWVSAWLVFGFPLIMVLSIVASLVLGRATVPRFDGRVAAWLLTVPFGWAMLVVIQSALWLLAIDLAHVIVRACRGAASPAPWARARALAVLGVVGVFAVYTPLRILVERGEIRVRHHEVGAPVATIPAPFRIAFLADVQQDVHTDAERARGIYAMINASKPDLVLSGGDWINTGPDHIESAAATAAELESRLGTFSVRGDHEHFAYADRARSVTEVERAMRGHGIAMLNNEVRWFDHHGKRIAVVFLNYNYIHRTDRATITSLVDSTAGADYRIAVTHQLDASLAALLADKVDLILGGHTHGGQVNPVVGVAHVQLARLETEYVDGRYRLGETTIIITAGIGYSILPFRYAAPGSIELIDLTL
ncbi:MAG TPA: metallophosphoesterase [Kofleriaceae bacterium]|nr:metallophosphoesterase [Kofleriaceae bacterium]